MSRLLSIDEIQRRITPICVRYGVKALYLFASYARGEATEKSDMDFWIERGGIEDLFTLSAFRLELVEVLGCSVDIVSTLPNINRFIENLKRDEVKLYAA